MPKMKVDLRDPQVILGDGSEPFRLRPNLADFVLGMEDKLGRDDDEKGRNGWKDMGTAALITKIKEECAELEDAIRLGHSPEDVRGECFDLANTAFFAFTNLGGRH